MCQVHVRSRRKRPARAGGQSWPFIQIGPVHIAGNMSRMLAGVPGPWFGPSLGRGATDHELIPGRKHRFAGWAGIDAAGPLHQPPDVFWIYEKVTANRRKWRIAGKRE
jgi:hypothetical protein